MNRNPAGPLIFGFAILLAMLDASCITVLAGEKVRSMGTPEHEILGRRPVRKGLVTTGDVREVLVPGPSVNAIAFCKTGMSLAVGRAYVSRQKGRTHGPIEIWNLHTSELEKIIEVQNLRDPDSAGIVNVACSPDGQTLASLHFDDTVRLWNLRNFKLVGEFSCAGQGRTEIADARPPSFSWTSNEEIIFTANEHTSLARYDLHSKRINNTWASIPATSTVSFFRNSSLMCVQNWDDKKKRFVMSIRDTNTGKTEKILYEQKDDTSAALISPASDRIAVPTPGKVFIWSPYTGRLLRTLPRSGWAGDSIVISPDGKLLASDDNNQIISIWNLSNGKLIKRLHTRKSESKLAFSPDGRTLAAAFDDGTIKLWRF